MVERVHFRGKREWMARGFIFSGAASLLSQLPDRGSLLVLNYHRIGNAKDDLFDPSIFSATAEGFDEQVSHLKRSASLVALDEALAFINGALKEDSRALPCVDHVRRRLQGQLRDRISYPAFARCARRVLPCDEHLGSAPSVMVHHRIADETSQRRRFTLHFPGALSVDIALERLAQQLAIRSAGV